MQADPPVFKVLARTPNARRLIRIISLAMLLPQMRKSRPSTRPRTAFAVTAVAIGLFGAANPARAVASPGAGTAGSESVCSYMYEWLRVVRFPLQPDPHGAYTYAALSTAAAKDHVAFLVEGPFPYAAWTSWDVYGAKAKPFAVANDSELAPDRGSVNPFVVGARVLARRRNFTLLYLPEGVSQSATARSLRRVAASNVFPTPTGTSAFILANRVYQAFPGYNMGGSDGPTNTPFPSVRAVNYDSGQPVSCAPYDLAPPSLRRPPTSPPRTGSTRLPPSEVKLSNGEILQRADLPSGAIGFEYAPPNPPGVLQFTRPPLIAGADVSAVPPPDNCAGYLGTATSRTRISLIRMPRVPSFFDVRRVGARMRFPETEAAYVSATQYGGSLGVYAPGRAISTSVGDAQLKVDRTGGTTILVWPRRLSRGQQRTVVAYARRRGWAILRGGTRNKFTSSNLFIREKRSSAYRFGVGRVPCYFGTPGNPIHDGQRWRQVTGSDYVASPRNIGPGAPQGVTCTVGNLTRGDCLRRLKAYIRRSGGSYFAR